MKVGLVGEGDRVEALAHLLRNHEVHHWSASEVRELDFGAHVERAGVEAIKQTPLVILCLPIHRLSETARQLGAVLSGRHVLVHTIRNVEPGTLKTASAIMAQETPTLRFGFLTGPFDAEDVLAGRPSAGVCVSEFDEVHDLVADALDAEAIRVFRAKDLRGAELGAAYTRVIAMLVGVARQTALGPSLEALLVTRGLAEAARFSVFLGGYEASAWGLAGCGNLYLDIAPRADKPDPGVRRLGDMALGVEFQRRQNGDAHQVARDIRSAFPAATDDLFNLIASLFQMVDGSGVHLPILTHAHKLVRGEMSTDEVVRSLLSVPVYFE